MATTKAAVVVSAGKMTKTVKVRMVRPEWNRYLRKVGAGFPSVYSRPLLSMQTNARIIIPQYFYRDAKMLVNDPTEALCEGDVIRMMPELHSKRVKHTVSEIVAPFSKPISERPPLLTQQQREEMKERERIDKIRRRAMRGAPWAVEEAKKLGMGIGQVYEEANREGHHVERERTVEHGREVQLGTGLHDYGDINTESREGANRVLRRMEKGKQEEKERKKVEGRSTEEVARETLDRR